jgi:hypothetical protein
MSAILKNIEDQIKNLNVRDLKEFRVWYEEYESDNWDNIIELDAKSENFQHLADEVLMEHKNGKTKQL